MKHRKWLINQSFFQKQKVLFSKETSITLRAAKRRIQKMCSRKWERKMGKFNF